MTTFRSAYFWELSKTTVCVSEQEVSLILQNEDNAQQFKKAKKSNPIFSKVHNDIPVCSTVVDDDAGIASPFIGFSLK